MFEFSNPSKVAIISVISYFRAMLMRQQDADCQFGSTDRLHSLLHGREIARVDSKLLSTEMAGGFTGITIGPYCRSGRAEFDGFDYSALSN